MPSFVRLLALACISVPLAACGSGQASSPAQPADPAYVTLDPGLSRLRDDFNADAGKVRLLYIVGPTCPVCLRGMDDLGKALAADEDDARLHTFVVYVPALGAKASDIGPTLALLPGKHVQRYWDPKGASGRSFEGTLDIKEFAWDVWMVYAPGQRWDGSAPPVPAFWMDQLGGLPEWRRLDAGTFAKQVAGQLASAKAGGA